MTLFSFGGWNFPRRRVVDDHVGTRDGATPELQLSAAVMMTERTMIYGPESGLIKITFFKEF